MTTSEGRPVPPARPPGRPEIPAARYGDRIAAAQALAERRGVAALLLGVGADLRYLTGYDAMPLERLTMLVLSARGRPTLVAPRLEAMRAAGAPAAASGLVEVVPWDETEDAHAIVAGRLGAERQERLLVSDGLWALHVLALQRALPGHEFALATEVLRDLRMAKDPDEAALLRLAAEAADRALTAVAEGPLIGRTEVEVSREIRDRLVAEGHDEAGFAIVGSGPNSASPHHEPGERRIGAGEPVVLDIGGALGGYGSDVTRTIWVAGPAAAAPDPEFLAVHDLVRRANAAATEVVRPGLPAEHVDAAAREVISAGGHGPAFLHRTGHGIGLETHEDPYLVAGNREPILEAAAFSIEPGIYLEGRFGVRIEDIVICRADGAEVLNRLPRNAWIVKG
jgi:Xaa-Pro aminopeptidase